MKNIIKMILMLGTFFMLSCMDMYNEVAEETGAEYKYFIAFGSASSTVSIYSLDSSGVPSLAHTETVGQYISVSGIAADPGGNYLYVSNNTDNLIVAYAINKNGSLISLGNYSTSPVTSPGFAAVHPSGKYLYIGTTAGNSILMYRIQSNGTLAGVGSGYISTLPADSNPGKMVFHPSGKYLFVALRNGTGFSILEVNDTDGSLTLIQTRDIGAATHDIAVHPGGNYIYVSGLSNSNIYKVNFDTSTGFAGTYISKSIGTNNRTSFVTDSAGDYLYVKLGYSSYVFAYQINTDGSLATDPADNSASLAGGYCYLIIHPDMHHIYCTDIGGGNRFYYNVALINNSTFDDSLTPQQTGFVVTYPILIRKKI